MLRPRFEELVKSSEDAQLALVQAPAGFGKTTVMLDWLKQLKAVGTLTGWLTLDEADNDVGRFLTYLVGVARSISSSAELENLLPENLEEVGGHNLFLMNLLDHLASVEVPFAIFLDEFEVIRNSEIHEIVKKLITVLPSTGLLVVGTRITPGFGLGRLRARGRLIEVGENDLRFTLEEASSFLGRERGLSLDREDIEKLQRRTEGWAAGLQLASLACAGVANPKNYIDDFSGATAEISDYLGEDVFLRQSEEVQSFLLKTSILPRLTGRLCNAVTGGDDSYEMLSQLEQANLFLIPLDSERRWYRYHPVFAQFLQSRLERDDPEQVRALHLAAADWFEEQGNLTETVAHCLAIDDLDRAAAAMDHLSRDLVVRLGQWGTLIRWVESLPPNLLSKNPNLQLNYAWALSLTQRYLDAEAVLEKIIGGTDEASMDKDFLAEVAAVRALGFGFIDAFRQALEVGQEGWDLTDKPSVAKGSLGNAIAYCSLCVSDFEKAQRYCTASAMACSQSGNEFGYIYALCIEGLLKTSQGLLREAKALYTKAIDHSRAVGPASSVPLALSSALLGDIFYQQGSLDEAERLLEPNLNLFSEMGLVDTMVIGARTLARIYIRKGKEEQAYKLLENINKFGIEHGSARVVATANIERMRLCLEKGDLNGARSAAQKWDDASIWQPTAGCCIPANDPDSPEIARIRMLLGNDKGKEALPLINSALIQAEKGHRFRQAMKLRLLLAHALERSGERKLALRTLLKALKLGVAEGFVQTVVEEGEKLAELLHQLRKTAAAMVETQEDADLLAHMDKIIKGVGVPEAAIAQEISKEELFEESAKAHGELTEREQEVLELLAQGMSNDDLADKLCVSYATVRYHLRNINLKLGSKSRIQAVALGRKFHLIP